MKMKLWALQVAMGCKRGTWTLTMRGWTLKPTSFTHKMRLWALKVRLYSLQEGFVDPKNEVFGP